MEKIIKPVLWTIRALNDIERINVFNEKMFGNEKSFEITESILKRVLTLSNPAIDYTSTGSEDAAFSHYKRSYRKLIESHYKITYRIGETKIYVTRIFDTRQHPRKNK